MIVQDEQGRSDFEAYKRAMERRPETLVFMAFDLLHLNGRDLRAELLLERRLRLQELVGCHDPSCRIQYSDHVIGNGADLFDAADRMGLEGIVSKRIRSRYCSGRSRDWLKIKCFAEAEFVVIGVERTAGRPAAALLAREASGRLLYAGGAMITLPSPDRDQFWRTAEWLGRATPPLEGLRSADAQWLEPKMRVVARYLKGSDKLRHATLRAILHETVA